MFKEKRLFRRKINRERKPLQSNIALFLEGSFLIAGGITGAIYFCIDLYHAYIDFLSFGGLFLSIVSGATGYHLIEKANRNQ